MTEYSPLKIAVLKIHQPIGEFFIGSIKFSDLLQVSYADMRRIEREFDKYIGIQRKLNEYRVKEIARFVNTVDAVFPTSVVLSVPGECADYEEKAGILTLHEDGDIPYREIAKILDGQHRIEGLREFNGHSFDIPVTIFVEADIADQAYVFATVNLAQTKVNRSLAYDLLDYSKARSPQKTCHDVAVALDRLEASPFFGMIKRLGSATPGRTKETLTQATFVNSLIDMLSPDPVDDRDILLRGRKLRKVDRKDLPKYPLRNLFIDELDTEIAKILMEYFDAVRETWPRAWSSRERGDILPRTNGFRALMRFFKVIYLHLVGPNEIGRIVRKAEYADIFAKLELKNHDFNVENFQPGTSGETKLFQTLREQSGL